MKHLTLIAILLLAPSAGAAHAQPAPAQSTQATTQIDAYADLYNSINEGVDNERVIDQISATIAQQLATADPALVEMEAAFPGYAAALTRAIRPAFARYSNRVREEYRPKMIAAFVEVMTPGEARDAAELYRSPLGRKMLGGVVANYDAKATVASGLKDDDIGGEAIAADQRATVRKTIAQFTQEELAELDLFARTRPGLRKLGLIGAKTTALRVAMENEPMTGSEEQELNQSIETASQAHVDSFKD